MRTFFSILLVSLAAVVPAAAQSLEAFERQLTEAGGSARVEIHKAPEAAAAFSAASRGMAERRHAGWRITLFSSNGQNARAEAYEVKRAFGEAYPGLSVDMVYENPYFKVSAGRCATAEEAIMLLERVRVRFPKAFLMRETMSATDLLDESPVIVHPAPDGADSAAGASAAEASRGGSL